MNLSAFKDFRCLIIFQMILVDVGLSQNIKHETNVSRSRLCKRNTETASMFCSNFTSANKSNNGVEPLKWKHSENITSQRSSASQSQPDMVSLFCLSDDDHYVTQFQRNDKFVVIYRNSPREITILVRNFPDDHLLIWYDNDFLHEINTIDFIRCIVSTDNHTQKIIVSDDLEQDKIYIFCLVHKDTMLIFPLNCVAYQQLKKPDTINQCRTEVMPQDAKMKLIFGLIAVYLICVFIGAFLICAIHGKLVELCKGKAKCSNNNGQNEAFGGAASGTE